MSMKEEVIKRLEATRGDDLIRAEMAFKGQDLTEQHGQSGKTRNQILGEYRDHDNQLNACIAWVKRST